MPHGCHDSQNLRRHIATRADGHNRDGAELRPEHTGNANRLPGHENRDDHLQEQSSRDEEARQGVEHIHLNHMPDCNDGKPQQNGEHELRAHQCLDFHHQLVMLIVLGIRASLQDALFVLGGNVRQKQQVVAAAGDGVQTRFHQHYDAQRQANPLDAGDVQALARARDHGEDVSRRLRGAYRDGEPTVSLQEFQLRVLGQHIRS